ncbi:MAG TPA: 50S ribosomal protein L11 [Patescibacteria group bacterium]|nr:50S ribosomal protein L11 [Patescibacteria group bacterium]
MAKKIKTTIKLQLPAGKATPAPPVGTALGPHGLNIAQFVKEFNDKTAQMGDMVIPVLMTVFEDRTYSFILKTPPVPNLIMKAIGLQKGAANPLTTKVGKIKMSQIKEIAQKKMPDLNTTKLESAMQMVIGSCRSMGVEVIKD